jgi:hypothetical protein
MNKFQKIHLNHDKIKNRNFENRSFKNNSFDSSLDESLIREVEDAVAIINSIMPHYTAQ